MKKQTWKIVLIVLSSWKLSARSDVVDILRSKLSKSRALKKYRDCDGGHLKRLCREVWKAGGLDPADAWKGKATVLSAVEDLQRDSSASGHPDGCTCVECTYGEQTDGGSPR